MACREGMSRIVPTVSSHMANIILMVRQNYDTTRAGSHGLIELLSIGLGHWLDSRESLLNYLCCDLERWHPGAPAPGWP